VTSAPVRARPVQRGQSIGAHDLWIAATALAHGHGHGLGVATRNAAHFQRVQGLRVVTPGA
jgi:predicted nucleic acid-binding protein